MGTKVRILTAITIDGITYQPNQVVDLPAAAVKQYQADGAIDPHKDAVAYCLKEFGVEVVAHKVPVAAAESTNETTGQAVQTGIVQE